MTRRLYVFGGRAIAGFCAVFALAIGANAQWTVVNLHPAGADRSGAQGVDGGQQVGWARAGDVYHAGLWSGSAASWVDLSPAGATESYATGVDGGQQVGYARFAGSDDRAGLWSGTAASWLNLNPTGAPLSQARGVSSGQQVGVAQMGGIRSASLWSGSAATWVNLHPADATESYANGVDGGQQVGEAHFGFAVRASLWSGTAASWVNLNPAGASHSSANGAHGGQQVGWAEVDGVNRASLWTGTAASWVNLNPAGASESRASGVSGGQQVGSAAVGGMFRAALWSGTAASWVDLHAFLPAGFTYSFASGIWHDATFTYVVGMGFNSATNRDEALMWVSMAIAPTSYSMFRGTVFSGNLNSILSSDGNKLVLRPGVVLTSGEPPVQVRINSTAPSADPNGISFSVESSASFAFAQQKISLWNYDTGAYELLDTRVVATSDDTVTVTVRTNAHRFIDNGTLAMRALVSYRAIGPSILYPWSARIDKVWWTFPG